MAPGEGEESGLHVSPFVQDAVVETPSDASEGDAAISLENSATQLLPMVRSEGTAEAPIVRAVARRVASALPALGREDGISDTPRSARTSAGRRRRAAAEAQAAAPTSGAPEADTSTASNAAPAVVEELVVEEPVVEEPVVEEPILEVTAPVVEPVAETVRAIELVLEPLSVVAALPVVDAVPAPKIPAQAAPRGDLEPVALVGRSRSHGMPISHGGEVSAPPLMGQPAPLAYGDVLDAEILDDTPPTHTSVNAAAAEVLTALTEVAFREARTDEWIMGQPERVVAPSSVLELVRPGPAVLDSDSWDAGVLPAVEQDSYQGRRRAVTAGGRLWLVISLVVSALIAAIAIPFVLSSNEATPGVTATPDGRVPSADNSAGISSAPGSPTVTSGPALPIVGASPLITPSPTPSPTPPPFLLAIQAEQGNGVTAWGGTAGPPTSFAGATVIDELGEHWPGSTTDGWLEFRNVTAPSAGAYRLRIYYVYTNQTPQSSSTNPSSRSMRVIVNESQAPPTQTFTPVSTITTRDVSITLRVGANTIRLTHPDDECPAVDRIEITKA